MNVDESINYWKDISSYDLVTAKAMIKTGRYLYVGFMCHQAIEKILKGFYVFKRKEIPPYVHNLMKIANLSGLYTQFSEEQKNLIDYLEPLNIEARYPGYKEALLKELTKKKCKEILINTQRLYKWIKAKF